MHNLDSGIRAKPGTIRKQNLERSREALLVSAIDLFSEFGFDGTSMRTIATRAGVNHGMIRHIFGSKEELWHDAVAYLFSRATSELNIDTTGLTARQRFESIVRSYVRYCARHPEHARLMIQLSIDAGPKLDWATTNFIRARHLYSVPLIDELKASGDLPDVETSSIFFSLVAACQMIFVLAPEVRETTGRNMSDPLEIERHADAVLGLFLVKSSD